MANKVFRRINHSVQVLLTGKIDDGRRDAIPPINAEEVAEARQFFPMEKFFIFGHARSGTTLLTRLVRLHPDVHCNYQAHFFSRPPLLEGLVADIEVGKWFTRSSNRWNRNRDLSPVVLRAVSDFILERDARREGKNVVGDKSPNSLLNGEAVQKLYNTYPDARLIFIVRDGRDAVLSHRIQTFIDNPHQLSGNDKNILESFVQDPEPFLSGRRSLFTQKGIVQAAQGWVNNVKETNDLGLQLFGDKYYSMKFEELIFSPVDEMLGVWSFLNVDVDSAGLKEKINAEMQRNPDADWQHEKASQIAGSLNKGKQGSWKDILTQQDKQTFNNIAGETLQDWGYTEQTVEKDRELHP